MPSIFRVVLEEFQHELDAIRILIRSDSGTRLNPRARVAGANAAVLLLAATFEEAVRELAREYARAVVAATPSYDRLPPKIAAVAWRRTMEELAKFHLNPRSEAFSRESLFSDAQTKFSVIYQFCRGDLTQDIYNNLIHNENNMRPQELNSMFKLSGLSNACLQAAKSPELQSHLGADNEATAHGKLIDALENFFDRRNQTAHAVQAMRSVSPEAISTDIDLLRLLIQALVKAIEEVVPPPVIR